MRTGVRNRTWNFLKTPSSSVKNDLESYTKQLHLPRKMNARFKQNDKNFGKSEKYSENPVFISSLMMGIIKK